MLLTTLGLLAVLAAAAIPAVGMTLHKKDDAPYPGLADGAIESLDGSVEITDGDTTGTVSFSPEGFGSAPRVVTGVELESSSGGASTTQVDRVEVTTRQSDSVDVRVELDAAPGAGESATVRVDTALFGS